jgi:hypothetical protein
LNTNYGYVGGFTLLPNTNATVILPGFTINALVDPAGANWTHTAAPGYGWASIASSADGSHLVAVDGGGNGIWTSTNSGLTWAQANLGENLRSIASSPDGMHLIAGGDYDVFTSSNGGVTWTLTSLSDALFDSWSVVTTSADGIHLAASDVVSLWTSSDGGLTWTLNNNNNGFLTDITSSLDGSQIATVDVYGYGIFTSTDSGATWTDAFPLFGGYYPDPTQWPTIASSADGSRLVLGDSSGRVFWTSRNYGVGWILNFIEFSVQASSLGSLQAISLSWDGTHLAAATSDGHGIWTSTGTVNPVAQSTTYHYRLVARNSSGTSYGADMTFTTVPGGAAVGTLAATGITTSNAMLNCTITPGGSSATAWFEYGLTTNYGTFTTTNNFSASSSPSALASLIGNLAPGTTYHYQLVSSNSSGISLSGDQTFTSTIAIPTVATLAATSITATNATLNGVINPGNGGTTAWFQYVTSTASWVLNGGTVLNGSQLTLTDGQMSEARSAFLSVMQNITQFSASFVYKDVGGGVADGTTFVLQNSPTGAYALGGGGGYLGYFGITNSFALELNLYNGGPGGTGFAWGTNGFTGTSGGAPYASTSPVNLASGDPIQVNLVYTNGSLVLSMTDLVTSANFTTTNAVNLPAILGGNTAYFGFTAGTGSLVSRQTIDNFVFNGQNLFNLPLFNLPLQSSPSLLAVTNANLSLSSLVSNLAPATTYSFQVFATNSAGLSHGVFLSFTTANTNAIQPLSFNLMAAGAASAGGVFQLSFTNLSGLNFTVLGTTNLATPLVNWTVLGSAVESPAGSGNYQFTDTQAKNQLTQFYRVSSP